MSKFHRTFALFMFAALVVSCSAPKTNQPTPLLTNPTFPSATPQETATVVLETRIVRHPQPADLSKNYEERNSVPKFDPNSTDVWQIDLRSRDLTEIDLRFSPTDLMQMLRQNSFGIQHCKLENQFNYQKMGKSINLESFLDPQALIEVLKSK